MKNKGLETCKYKEKIHIINYQNEISEKRKNSRNPTSQSFKTLLPKNDPEKSYFFDSFFICD